MVSQGTVIAAAQAYIRMWLNMPPLGLLTAHLLPKFDSYIGHNTIWDSGGHFQFG